MYYIYIVIAALWLIATVFWQFEAARERSRALRMINVLHILPIWTFFAPRPGMSDTHLLYRDLLGDGTLTPWHEVTLIEARRAYHWLWNPTKRFDKLVVDALSDVKTVKNRGDADQIESDELQSRIKLSKGYIILLNTVMAERPSDVPAKARQFAVLDASFDRGDRAVTPLFASPFHEVGGMRLQDAS